MSEGEAHPEEIEFLQMKKLTLDKVGGMIELGEILDGPTIVAYHFLEKYLEKR